MLYNILVLLLIFGVIGCATPMPPSGGPSDDEGPELEYTIPETGTTNFEGRTFEFQFNEFVDRSSVRDAITVEPDLGIPYEISWKRKTLFIEFERPFPDSTTVIVKLGTELSDTRNNEIGSPITVATSTGDEIDSGEISGRVLLAGNGKGAAERKVLLYRRPIDFSRKAIYEAQTDTGGVFEFLYLAPGTYQALLVDDRNRNKIWDQENEQAYPFSQEFITLQKEQKDTLDVLYTTQTDTLKPELQGVGLFSTHRMRLRFSENIALEDSVAITIYDSLGTPYSSGYPLYVSPKEPFVLFAQSRQNLTEGESFSVNVSGVNDPAGNAADTSRFTFMGTAQEDTTLQRIISAETDEGLLQNEPFVVTYAAPITEPEITDSTVVIEGEVDFDDWPAIEVQRNKLVISPQGEWIEGVDYQFLVWNPVTQRRTPFEPEVYDSTEYGEIEISLANMDSLSTYRYQLQLNDEIYRSGNLDSLSTLSELPPVSYKLIVYEDQNLNGQWDRGTVIPYQAPEPYYVQRGLRVQEGFTSEVSIGFRH
ncbi:Ig-like domain-containing protein [Gracilimonas mengyeensis]|uniref:Ig-like domain-containing protein n=1 Tax=Gracilimonas mengyeensis TaxID=1302730 RepID=A0A521EYV7_9BACT|nr:Ig-like domain-containing protein [Gracilimonas mengyeensis]